MNKEEFANKRRDNINDERQRINDLLISEGLTDKKIINLYPFLLENKRLKIEKLIEIYEEKTKKELENKGQIKENLLKIFEILYSQQIEAKKNNLEYLLKDLEFKGQRSEALLTSIGNILNQTSSPSITNPMDIIITTLKIAYATVLYGSLNTYNLEIGILQGQINDEINKDLGEYSTNEEIKNQFINTTLTNADNFIMNKPTFEDIIAEIGKDLLKYKEDLKLKVETTN